VGGAYSAAVAHPNAIILAIYGYHFRKVFKKHVA
jgi:hypothetical protein